MKINTLIFAFLLCTSTAFSQINLENTYTTNGDDAVSFSFVVENGYYFYTLGSTENTVKIYNSSHNLAKTVNLSVDAGYTLEKIYLPSDKLFNDDSKIEFIALLSGDTDSKMILFNEDGSVLKDLGSNRWSAYYIKVSNNTFKLITVESSKSGSFSYDVYSLPGTLTPIQESLLKSEVENTFPNPAEDVLTIANIPPGKAPSLIEIYDENGKLVQQVTLDANHDNANIDISSLKSGFYIYKSDNMTGKFIKK